MIWLGEVGRKKTLTITAVVSSVQTRTPRFRDWESTFRKTDEHNFCTWLQSIARCNLSKSASIFSWSVPWSGSGNFETLRDSHRRWTHRKELAWSWSSAEEDSISFQILESFFWRLFASFALGPAACCFLYQSTDLEQRIRCGRSPWRIRRSWIPNRRSFPAGCFGLFACAFASFIEKESELTREINTDFKPSSIFSKIHQFLNQRNWFL